MQPIEPIAWSELCTEQTRTGRNDVIHAVMRSYWPPPYYREVRNRTLQRVSVVYPEDNCLSEVCPPRANMTLLHIRIVTPESKAVRYGPL